MEVLHLKIASKTDMGLVRNSNQDSYAAGELMDGTAWAVVCDGMGGANGGNVASANAVKIISEYISSSYHENMNSNSIKTLLQSAICGANVRLYDMAHTIESLQGMGTTVVAVIVSGGMVHITHAGDSRAYLIRDNKMTQITKDHSIVQSMVDKGQLTAEEAKNHPKRNVITRALGVNEDIEFEYNETEFYEGDKILICTDGLTNYVSENDIECIISDNNFYEYPQALIDLANNRGGGDNITIVVLSD